MVKFNLRESEIRLSEVLGRTETIAEAKKIALQVAEEYQKRQFDQFSVMVSKALSSVFDDPYEFKIIYTQRAGKTNIEFKLLRDGMELDPMSSVGGGVLDITAFVLRVVAILTSKPAHRSLVILDEPFRFVSVEYRERCKLFIEKLAAELGVQFILVTHMEELQCGKVIKIS